MNLKLLDFSLVEFFMFIFFVTSDKKDTHTIKYQLGKIFILRGIAKCCCSKGSCYCCCCC